jgi:HEPN domain-containing protein
LDKATEDLTVARLVLEEEHTAHACFLSQQCIEKAFKAYLVARTASYPRIHNLVDLLNLCEALDQSFSHFRSDCTAIDQYYVPTRYPIATPGGLPDGMPSIAAARKATNAAETILEFVTRRLG